MLARLWHPQAKVNFLPSVHSKMKLQSRSLTELSVHQADMGCDVYTKERLIRRGRKVDLASLLEIASGQAVQDTDFLVCLDSSVRFETSLLFDVALHNLVGFQVILYNFSQMCFFY